MKGETRDPAQQKKTRALKALSLKLDRVVEKWNNFAGGREDAQKEFEAVAKKFVEQSAVLGQGGSAQGIQALIDSKVSKIRLPARVTWEVWGGNPN